MSDIINEAQRCLKCKKAFCKEACPVSTDIPEIMKLFLDGHMDEAGDKLFENNPLSALCSLICPHEKQCKKNCVRAIKGEAVSIGELEAFIGRQAIENNWEIPKKNLKINKKIAVIGSGPSGLTCAAFLAKEGYKVTIFEKHSMLGGILSHGIPEFRLDKEILIETINKILELGIEAKTNIELNKDITLEQLEQEYDAIFLGFGANISAKMQIPGENLEGVFGGNELLETNKHPNYCDKYVAIIGGGNVAIDTARTIKRLGAKTVKVIYRRAEEQMPAEKKEIEFAKSEGIEFLFQTNILKILGDTKVEKIECIKTELKQKEGDSRPSPVNIENTNYLMDIDYVVMAVGSLPEKELTSNLKLEIDKKGKIVVNENNQTSNPKIFAGGDLIGEIGTVAWAARSGRNSAQNIIEFLKNK